MLGLIGAGLAIGGSRALAGTIIGAAKAGRGLAKAKVPGLYKYGTWVVGGAVAYKGFSEREDFKHQKKMSMYGDSEINKAIHDKNEFDHKNKLIIGAGLSFGGAIAGITLGGKVGGKVARAAVNAFKKTSFGTDWEAISNYGRYGFMLPDMAMTSAAAQPSKAVGKAVNAFKKTSFGTDWEAISNLGRYGFMLPDMAMTSAAAQRSKAVGKAVGKAVSEKGHSGISKMFRPSYDRSGLTYGAAAGVGAGLGMGLAGEGPRGRMAREGQIEGIDPSRGGGISPDLQFSTQGLTLGIHSKRKRRVI